MYICISEKSARDPRLGARSYSRSWSQPSLISGNPDLQATWRDHEIRKRANDLSIIVSLRGRRNHLVSPSYRDFEDFDNLLFATRVREGLEFYRDLVLLLETVRTLDKVGYVFLEEILRPRTHEAPGRLVCHSTDTYTDFNTAGYVPWIH